MREQAVASRIGHVARTRVRPYVLLLKPRVMSLVVFTAAVGLLVAPEPPDFTTAVVAIALIALGAGAAGALNMWWDADIDIQMRRTRTRPVPMGHVSGRAAMWFGLVLSVVSVAALGVVANMVAAGLLAFTIFFYAVIYTVLLKRRTPQNIVIGGAAGALPPVVGWAVSTGVVSVASLSLFLLIFTWTPPHFWSLALFMRDDYDRAGVPMLTVTHGRPATRRHILVYSLLLSVVSFLPVAAQIGQIVYATAAIGLNVAFVAGAITVARRNEAEAEADHYAAERRLFKLSLWYLFLLFSALIVDASGLI